MLRYRAGGADGPPAGPDLEDHGCAAPRTDGPRRIRAGRKMDEVCTACWTDEQPVALPIGEGEQLGLFDKTQR